jgi:iron-sulfur cluster assembly protein
MSYKMSFEEAASEKDQVFTENTIQVVLDPKSALFLQGLTVNYEDGLNGAGFTYENPKAKKSCGCGTSFAV